MTSWVSNLQGNVDLFLTELVHLHEKHASDSKLFASLASHYMEAVHNLYQADLPAADLLDSSHLVAHYSGSTELQPTFTLMSSLCGGLDKCIRGLAESIYHMRSSNSEKVKWPKQLVPNLTGIVPGSLTIGVRIGGESSAEDGQQDMFADELKLMAHDVERALDGVATIGRHLSDGVISDEFRQEYEDPAIRDTILSAAKKVAPTGRFGGISEVAFQRRSDASRETISLTKRERGVLNRELNREERQAKHGKFTGIVRAIDLDTNRFVLRQVEGWGAVRCVHRPADSNSSGLNTLLNATVSVSGVYQTAPGKNAPRLMNVHAVNVINSPSQQSELEL